VLVTDDRGDSWQRVDVALPDVIDLAVGPA
jgi:hypothetical protein